VLAAIASILLLYLLADFLPRHYAFAPWVKWLGKALMVAVMALWAAFSLFRLGQVSWRKGNEICDRFYSHDR